MRLGLPDYANVAPLARFLPDGFSRRRGVPTELNRALLKGEVELSLVSSAFYLEHQDKLAILPDFSVAVLGRVYSVNVFSKKPFEALKRVAVTPASATSVALLGWLRPDLELVPVAGGLELLEDYDGVLLIGDPALKAYAEAMGPWPSPIEALPEARDGLFVTDLSSLWFERTRLPFVFAVWAHPKDRPPDPEAIKALRQARETGLARLGEVSEAEARRLGVPAGLMLRYLWNFRYHLEAPDRLGLANFAEALKGRAF